MEFLSFLNPSLREIKMEQDLVFSVHFDLTFYPLSLIPYPLSLPLVPYPLVLLLSQNLGEGEGDCDCCHCHCYDCPHKSRVNS